MLSNRRGMYQTSRFSQKSYALDMTSYSETSRPITYQGIPDGNRYFSYRLNALWIRKRRGVVGVNFGALWCSDRESKTLSEFLETIHTGRYGADCKARWDGNILWTQNGANRETIDFLEPLLEEFKKTNTFAGYSTWWRFN